MSTRTKAQLKLRHWPAKKSFKIELLKAFSKLTASSRHDHKKVALAVLNRPRDEQNHIDESEDADKDQISRVVFDVRSRQLVRQSMNIGWRWFLAGFVRARHEPSVDAANRKLSSS